MDSTRGLEPQSVRARQVGLSPACARAGHGAPSRFHLRHGRRGLAHRLCGHVGGHGALHLGLSGCT
eukprot:6496261-Pyramimonas_sp.AAC.1